MVKDTNTFNSDGFVPVQQVKVAVLLGQGYYLIWSLDHG